MPAQRQRRAAPRAVGAGVRPFPSPFFRCRRAAAVAVGVAVGAVGAGLCSRLFRLYNVAKSPPAGEGVPLPTPATPAYIDAPPHKIYTPQTS